MSYQLPHLHNAWQVDQAILSEEDRVVTADLLMDSVEVGAWSLRRSIGPALDCYE